MCPMDVFDLEGAVELVVIVLVLGLVVAVSDVVVVVVAVVVVVVVVVVVGVCRDVLTGASSPLRQASDSEWSGPWRFRLPAVRLVWGACVPAHTPFPC